MNNFYTNFDKERLRLNSEPRHARVLQSIFRLQREYVVVSGSFHRLQGKTQVFLSGEYDFYRTRLTHSLEVASIGRSICSHLLHNRVVGILNDEFFIDFDLVETICLAHDLGNPPFGHAGEGVLHDLMKDKGGFEGNAQSLRILTQILFSSPSGRRGISPTRALLDGVLKYKRTFSQNPAAANHFIYDFQEEVLEFLFEPEIYAALKDSFAADPTAHQSIECQIMDHADDIANACFDILDGVKARFITVERLGKWRERHSEMVAPYTKFVDRICSAVATGWEAATLMTTIGGFVKNTRVIENPNPPPGPAGQSNRYRYQLSVRSENRDKIAILKSITKELVFTTSAIHQLEHKGGIIIRAMYREIEENYTNSRRRLFPDEIHEEVIKNPATIYAHIRDHISGMTDQYLLRSYKRLFDPDFGSISELI